MSSKQNKRESTPNSYKYIHLKSSNASIKQTTQTSQDKNAQYFPIKKIRQQDLPYNLDTSKANTNKQYSQSSRYSKRESLTNNVVSLQEYRNILKENQKLKKQMAKYQKMALEKDDQKSITKKLQLELVETYRVIHFYQGKIKQQQKICKLYEKQLNSNDPKKSKINKTDLLQDLRNSNSQLRGQLEQKSFEMNKLAADLRKAELRHYNNQHKIMQLNKKISDNRFIALKPKFTDDYQQNNLICSPSTPQTLIKRRPLSKNKKILRTPNRQSDSDGSGVSSEYKNNVYIKRKTQNISQSRQNSLNTKGIGNLNIRLANIEKEIQALKKQNQKLHEELDAKTKELIRLKAEKQKPELKITLSKEEPNHSSNELKKISISKDKLRQIENPKLSSNKSSQNNLSMYVSNISNNTRITEPSQKPNTKIPENQKQTKKQGYIFSEIKQRTLRKLTLNLARQDVTYFKLIDNIVECWISQNPNNLIELLEESPYQLTSSQTSQFMFEYKSITKYIQSKERQSAHKDMNETEYKQYVSNELKNILKNNIAYFKNITIRRDFTLNIQISNKLKNYQHELTQIINKYGNKLPINQCQKVLVGPLGLTSQQFLFLQIKNNEEYEDIDFIHMGDLGKYFLLQ